MRAVLTGFSLGFLVALQVGPMTLFLVRSGLRGGWRSALAVAAGIAGVDGLYALCGAAGVTPLLALAPLRLALGCVGATVLIVLGIKTLRASFRVRLGAESADEVVSPRRTFLTALGGTASNPLRSPPGRPSSPPPTRRARWPARHPARSCSSSE